MRDWQFFRHLYWLVVTSDQWAKKHMKFLVTKRLSPWIKVSGNIIRNFKIRISLLNVWIYTYSNPDADKLGVQGKKVNKNGDLEVTIYANCWLIRKIHKNVAKFVLFIRISCYLGYENSTYDVKCRCGLGLWHITKLL